MISTPRIFTRTAWAAAILVCTLLGANRSQAQISNRSGEDSTIFISHTVFVPKYPYESGQENWGIAAGDINHDGFIDLVSASQLDSKVNVHLNDGKGKFNAKRSYPAGNFNRDLVLLDANGDGWLDIATVSIKDQALSWLINDGSGGFYPKKSVPTGPFPHDVWADDVTGDGNVDLITITNGDSKVNVHAGDGKGNFAGKQSFPAGYRARSVRTGDINGDGYPDLVVGAENRSLHVLINRGNGSFNPGQAVTTGESIWGLGIADFNGDGKMDIAATSYTSNELCIHLNKGEYRGKLQFEKQCVGSGDKNFDLVLGDFDMDGDVDVVTASTRDEVINVHLNNGSGVFSETNRITSGNWNSAIVAADFDGDKDLDIATSSIKDSRVNVHRNVTVDPIEEKTSTCVRGTVRDKDSNEPLVALVSVVGPDGYSVANMKTGPDGKYELCDIPFGKGYVLKVKSQGYPPYEESFDLPKETGEAGLTKDVYLQKIKESFIYGKITDIETGEPLPGAQITITHMDGTTMAVLTADANGDYKKVLPFADNYLIQVSKEKYNEKSGVASLYPIHHPKGLEKNFQLQKVKPKTTGCINGYVINANTEEPIADATVKVLDKEGNIIKTVKSNSEGWYEACNIPFGTYDVSGNKRGFMFRLEKDVELNLSHAEGAGARRDIPLIPFEIGAKIVLENIYYDVAKATLRPESRAELDRLIQIMNENPTLKIELGGHTDSDGSDSYNQRLSQNRAQSVVDYLIDAGVSADRLEAHGYGEEEPVVPNTTKENKQMNRRTEIKVLSF